MLQNVADDLQADNGAQPKLTGPFVYLFSEVDKAQNSLMGDWDAVRGLLGGKGANLGDMTRLGIPVPPGFTVTSVACNAYLDSGEKFPPGMWDEILAAVSAVQTQAGRVFGDKDNPLLVSCRSG
ncbi:MAG: hypothetical protein KDE34_18970, partial [Anaerolineales bacterium]|nr:hypothetical protein [Anaerolineales bacterium]